jgi:hypothetical protein
MMALLTILMSPLAALPALRGDWDGVRRARMVIAWARPSAGFAKGSDA